MHQRLALLPLLLALLAVSACDDGPTSPTANSSTGTAGSTPAATTATLRSTRFLAFGDSLTEGEVTSPTAGSTVSPSVVVSRSSYPAVLQDRLRARYTAQAGQVTVTNGGRSGELVAAAAPRLGQLLANSQTEVLLLLDGYNDLLDYGAGGVSPAIDAMNVLAQEGRHRGARVFIGLLPPPIAGRQRSVPDAVVRAFNDQLRAVAAGEGAVVVDTYTALSADPARYIGVDGHHPNEAGYQRIAEEFLVQIAANLENR